MLAYWQVIPRFELLKFGPEAVGYLKDSPKGIFSINLEISVLFVITNSIEIDYKAKKKITNNPEIDLGKKCSQEWITEYETLGKFGIVQLQRVHFTIPSSISYCICSTRVSFRGL